VKEGKGAEEELVGLLAELASLELAQERREELAAALERLLPVLKGLAALELGEEEPAAIFWPED